MPISGPSSYVSTTEQFEQHWELVDAALGAGNEIVFPDGTNLAALTAKKEALIVKRAEVQDKLNDKEIGRGDVEVKKAAMLDRMAQFGDRLRAFFAGSKWVNALPNAPRSNEAQSKFTDPLDDVNNLWTKINADPGTAAPIVLQGGYAQAAFAADLAALKTAYGTLNAAETTLKVTREERNDLQDQIYGILKTYRQVLPSFFAKGDALLESLPRLTPAAGSTPSAVTASGSWDAATNQARITWTASSEANLSSYQVRFSPGPDYSTEDESLVATVQPGGTLEVLTPQGVETPGSIASYRVYVLLSTGNEKGSNTVVVTNAGGPGPTPFPVTLGGSWNPQSSQADFTWSASASGSDVVSYIMRWSPGNVYDANQASDVATLPPTTTNFSTQAGLPTPGSIATYRVFTVVTGGAEAGSNDATVQRM